MAYYGFRFKVSGYMLKVLSIKLFKKFIDWIPAFAGMTKAKVYP